MVVGAVPGVAPTLADPPEMGSPSLALHNVVMVNTVLPALRLKLCCMKLAV
jgi:hypothetical protein